MSLLSSGGPDGYCQATRFCSCARKLARGSKAAGVLSGELAGEGVFGGRWSCGSLFPALNAAAVNNQALVADLDSGHVQPLMDQPECMAGLQSLLHLRPDGTKLSHQLRGLLPCERFDCGQRAFI